MPDKPKNDKPKNLAPIAQAEYLQCSSLTRIANLLNFQHVERFTECSGGAGTPVEHRSFEHLKTLYASRVDQGTVWRFSFQI
jgi:hypothetical protein